ncbi:secreted effector protein SseB [Pseudomonas frederiksbergensis]|uniref:hypothetical protein n=1 Tax=Pseudomonas frederiksbergensis TaxID=104087 RepID=UPI003D261BC8
MGPINDFGSINASSSVPSRPAVYVNSQSMFSGGIQTMQTIMLQLTQKGNDLFKQMDEKSAIARDAQKNANLVEAEMVKMTAPDAKGSLPDSVIEYMRANNIHVNGKTIDDFISESGEQLDKGSLMAVKSELESVSSSATDFNQQSQLKLQQVMQNYSTSSQQVQSMQSLLAEMNKGTAAAIR